MTRRLQIPELCLLVLVGPSGSGKSTFAQRHFSSAEIVSSDACREIVSDSENDQRATSGAFEVLHTIARERLRYGRIAVIDATNVQAEARKPLLALAREMHVLPVAVVLDTPEQVCRERNENRADRDFGPHVIRNQYRALKRMFPNRREGFHSIIVLKGNESDDVVFERTKLWTDKRHLHGPFDLIGDIHGCFDELCSLISSLGWQLNGDQTEASHPEGRTAVLLGDLVDRGPATPAVLRLAMNMAARGSAIVIPGNHENKLVKALRGASVKTSHGIAESLAQLNNESFEFREQVVSFMDGLVSHYVLDEGRLVVAHAGLREDMHGRASGAVRSFCLYGDTTGETDEYGLPTRYPWAEEYRGDAAVVYGHTPVPDATWLNNTICVDTGCVFGGKLTALRWPERELVSVDAKRTYYEPTRPLVNTQDESRHTLELRLDDVIGTRRIETSLGGTVTVREEQSAAALEVVSRFAADPRWAVYLPPTMSPPATSTRDGFLEYPTEAFEYYRSVGVPRVICEEKHMGSRAVIIVGRTPDAIMRQFGIHSEMAGNMLTRTGREFFDAPDWTESVVKRARAAISKADLWNELNTDWLILDAELLPWSAKADDLLRRQYAAVGASARSTLRAAAEIALQIQQRLYNDPDANALLQRTTTRRNDAQAFVESYRRYCWDVAGPDDLQLAPFQVLATANHVTARNDHLWHLDIADRMRAEDTTLFGTTGRIAVDLSDPASEEAATQWWLELTGAGGEGMVVKPVKPITTSTKGNQAVVQPGVKVRGREYLRIIYGPEYTDPANLDRLRQRGLGHKRALAAREFALGIEGLDRFVANEPLYRVHECAFAVLALESEPVDPRL